VLAAAVLLWGPLGLRADDPALTPVESAAGRSAERIDPMRTERMSAAERERLYEQAARDAELLETQGRQLRRLTDLTSMPRSRCSAPATARRPRPRRVRA